MDAMPSLEMVVALGGEALREVSGRRAWEVEERERLAAHRKRIAQWERAQRSYPKRLTQWRTKCDKLRIANARYRERCAEAELAGRKPPRGSLKELPNPPQQVAQPAPLEAREPIGFAGISKWRGSVLDLPGRPGVRLAPMLHPAGVLPGRQPRLRPLLAVDFRKAVRIWRGELIEPHLNVTVVHDAAALRGWGATLQPGEVAFDIEWSRQAGELVCVGLGQGTRYCIASVREPGWRAEGAARQELLAALQELFDRAELRFGGHFASSFDVMMLARCGLNVRCTWDSLYAFHLLFAEFGSPRDESAIEGGKGGKALAQASGYDLGFVSTMLTPFPMHKDFWDKYDDVLEAPAQVVHAYCAGDVARSWHAMQAMRTEAASVWPSMEAFENRLASEMEAARRARNMTERGLPIREAERVRRLFQVQQDMQDVQTRARELEGPGFNLGSGPQLARALVAKGVKVRYNPRTGNARMDGRAVQRILDEHASKGGPTGELLQCVADWRRLQKELGAYQELAPGADGRAHPSWKVHGTIAGRWSSTPNFQNKSESQRQVVG